MLHQQFSTHCVRCCTHLKMDPRIISVPEKPNNIPKESIGKLMFDKMSSFDKQSVALLEIKTGEVYTYGDLIEYSVNLASNLRGFFNIKKNDMLAIISENSHKFWIACLAAFYLATPVHLLNPGYTIYELKKFLNISEPKLLFCSKRSLDKIKSLRKDLVSVKTIIMLDDDDDDDDQVIFYRDLIKTGGLDFEIETNISMADQVAIVCNSSGTTGLPKGVMITHETFRLSFTHCEDPDLYPHGPHPCVVEVIPFFHIYGFGVTCCALYSQAKVLIMDQFDSDVFLETIQNHRVNELFIVPLLVNFLANSPSTDKYDLSSLEKIYSAAGVVSEELASAITRKFSLKMFRQTYGLTEVASGVCLTPINGSKPGSCGKLFPGLQAKIVDTQTGEILGVDQPGEICVRGAMMKGYLNDAEKTEETVDGDGFVRTGDLGYYDEERFFYVIERLKDLIKYKSFQVAPLEIEEILMQHPAIEDAAVVGKSDDRCGELPVAFVVKRGGAEIDEEEVREYVARHVCVEKRLHGGVRFVEELPRNNIGKVLRRQLRDMLCVG